MKRAQRARIVVALLPLLALGAACTGSQSPTETATNVPLPEDMPLCSDLFQPGKTIDQVEFGKACKTAEDELEVPRYIELDCENGVTLVWNEFAWGYVGQPMALWDPNVAVRIPTDQVLECNGTTSPIVEEAPPADGG